jgi:hypothetical protein
VVKIEITARSYISTSIESYGRSTSRGTSIADMEDSSEIDELEDTATLQPSSTRSSRRSRSCEFGRAVSNQTDGQYSVQKSKWKHAAHEPSKNRYLTSNSLPQLARSGPSCMSTFHSTLC